MEIVVIPGLNVSSLRLLHPEKVHSPRSLADPGIVIDKSFLQLEKAQGPIAWTLSGSRTEDRLLQFSNALALISVNPSGKEMLCSLVHPEKAFSPKIGHLY